MTVIYGIKNCDTVKKARRWLDDHDVGYEFHDYKQDGIDEKTLTAWCRKLGWETLLNRRGTTWRKLPDKMKETINEKSAIMLMLEQPSVIKRPLLKHGSTVIVGFDEQQYRQLLN